MPRTVSESEWARAKEVQARFGLGRTILYRLVAQGRVDAIRIDERGVRLYNVESIRKALRQGVEKGKL